MTNKNTNTYNVNSFSLNLWRLLDEKNISNEEFAEMIEVAPRMVSYYTSGEKYPKIPRLIKIAEALNVSIDSLLTK